MWAYARKCGSPRVGILLRCCGLEWPCHRFHLVNGSVACWSCVGRHCVCVWPVHQRRVCLWRVVSRLSAYVAWRLGRRCRWAWWARPVLPKSMTQQHVNVCAKPSDTSDVCRRLCAASSWPCADDCFTTTTMDKSWKLLDDSCDPVDMFDERSATEVLALAARASNDDAPIAQLCSRDNVLVDSTDH